MTIDHLRELLDYHYWARDRVLDAADRLTVEQFTRDLGSSFKSVRDTLVHVYGSEVVWCGRWLGESASAMVAPDTFGDVGTLRRAWRDHETRVREVLERFGVAGLDTIVSYKDLKGVDWQQPFRHLLQHVVNHASYHRGQVTTMIRQLGGAPGRSMDMIAFYRERASS